MERRILTREDLTDKLIGAIVTNSDQTFGNAVVIGVHPGSGEVSISTGIHGVRREFFGEITFIAPNLSEYMNSALNRSTQALLDFKAEVGEKAMAAAREHDWCSTVREVLSDLGIQPPNEFVKVRATVTFDLTMRRMNQTAWDKTDGKHPHPDLSWITNSFNVTDEGLSPLFEGDDDLELMAVHYVAREAKEVMESDWED